MWTHSVDTQSGHIRVSTPDFRCFSCFAPRPWPARLRYRLRLDNSELSNAACAPIYALGRRAELRTVHLTAPEQAVRIALFDSLAFRERKGLNTSAPM